MKMNRFFPLLQSTLLLIVSSQCAFYDAAFGDAKCNIDADCKAFQRCVEGDCIEPENPPNESSERWIDLSANSFDMGCSVNDDACFGEERPVHEVNLAAFSMMATEVTFAQMAEFLNAQIENVCGDGDCVDAQDPDLKIEFMDGTWRVRSGFENYPVVEVTYYGARDYCVAQGGRLPSEAEWEYAARAASTTPYYCGATLSCLMNIAWFNGNAEDESHPVASKAANDFGLYDMLGNVSEWTEDCVHDGAGYVDAPADGSVWGAANGGDCTARMLRGGSWKGNDYNLRVSARTQSLSLLSTTNTLGFRCVKSGA